MSVADIAEKIRAARETLTWFDNPLGASDLVTQAIAMLEEELLGAERLALKIKSMTADLELIAKLQAERAADLEPEASDRWYVGVLGQESGVPIARVTRGTPLPEAAPTVPWKRLARPTHQLDPDAAPEWDQTAYE